MKNHDIERVPDMKTKTRLKRGWRIALWTVAALALAMLTLIAVLTVKGYNMYREAIAA